MTRVLDPHPQDYTGDATTVGLRFVDTIARGSHVCWLHVARGGYGYTIHVPAVVASVDRHGGWATIHAKRADGTTKMVRVRTANLRREGPK